MHRDKFNIKKYVGGKHNATSALKPFLSFNLQKERYCEFDYVNLTDNYRLSTALAQYFV